MTNLIDAMVKAITLLEAHEVVPSTLEVSRATFEALKRECRYTNERFEPNTLMGIKIIVKG